MTRCHYLLRQGTRRMSPATPHHFHPPAVVSCLRGSGHNQWRRSDRTGAGWAEAALRQARARAMLRSFSTKPPSQDQDTGTVPSAPPKPPEPEIKGGFWDKVKRHGPVFMFYWNGLYVVTFLTIFGVIEYKVLGDIDAIEVATMIQLDRLINLDKINPTGGNLALAVAINEAFEVVRFPFALATLPYVTEWWERVRPASWAPKPGDPGQPTKPTFRELVAEHGVVFVAYWASLWALGAAAVYGALEYQLLGPEMDAKALAQALQLDHFIDLDAIDPRFPNLPVAFAVNEVLELIRLPFAVATVTKVTKWLKQKSP